MNPTQQLLEDIESLKTHPDGEGHRRASRRGQVPTPAKSTDDQRSGQGQTASLVRTCGSLHEFWTVIQDQIRTYAKRRSYITEQFDEVVTFLEQQAASSGDDPFSQLLNTVDAPHVAAAWQTALEKRESDPAEAISSARTLVETVCKHILDGLKVSYSDTDDLSTLYRLTADALNLSPSQHTEPIFRQILGGCQNVVEGLGAMQERHSRCGRNGSKRVSARLHGTLNWRSTSPDRWRRFCWQRGRRSTSDVGTRGIALKMHADYPPEH